MPNSPKARLIHKVVNQLRKRYAPPPRRESLPVLEHLIMAVLADGTTTAKADEVFHRLKAHYFDWNEVRVSAVAELQEALADLPDSEQRAARLKNVLRYFFETTYSFDLEQFRKLAMKEVARRLSKVPGSSPYLIARVIRDGMGGSALPMDSAAIRVLTRLELIDSKTTADVLGASLERLLARPRNIEFCHLLAEHAAAVCTETEPRCKPCVLLELCPFGRRRLIELQATAAAAAASARRSRSKTKPAKTRSKAR